MTERPEQIAVKLQKEATHKFTLLELLVIIAIITILAAILLPSLDKVKAKSKEINCVSNQKQIYLLLLNYCDDYNGIIIPSCAHHYWGEMMRQGGYLDQLSTYGSIFEPKNFSCPADQRTVLDGTYLFQYTHINGSKSYDYGLNEGIGPTSPPSGSKLPFKLIKLKTPSQTLWMHDADLYVVYALYPERNAFRHNGSLNSLFVDGHIAPQKSVPGSWTDVYWGRNSISP